LKPISKKMVIYDMAINFDINDYDLFIFDVEGVLVDDIDNPKRFEDAYKFMTYLKNEKKQFVCLSNIGRKSHRYIYENLKKLGFPVTPENIFSAGRLATLYFKENGYENARIYLISEGGVLEDFLRAGLNIVSNPPVDFVVVAMDRGLTYQKLNFAARMLLEGAKLIGVGGGFIVEGTYLGEKGKFLGEEAFVYMLSKATSIKPIMIGKPHKIIFDIILSSYQVDRSKVIIIGDKLETDIKGGKKAGIHTMLINRGRYGKEILDKLDDNERPDFTINSFDDIFTTSKD